MGFLLLQITKSSSAAGHTRRQLGNTSTCPYYALRHITKSSSAASNAWYGQVLVLPGWRLVHPAADDDFVASIDIAFFVICK